MFQKGSSASRRGSYHKKSDKYSSGKTKSDEAMTRSGREKGRSSKIRGNVQSSNRGDPLSAKSKISSSTQMSPHLARMKAEDLHNVEEFHELAKRKLPKMVYDYYASGADDQITLEESVKAFRRLKLRPRVFVDVSPQKLNYETTVLGKKIDFPICIAATAMHRMANEEGERATVRAAESMNTLYMLSSLSTTSIDSVAEASPNCLKWYQLYILKDREFVKTLIQNAEMSGYSAIVVTVDAPRLGNREADHKNKFQLPEGLSLAILQNSLKQNPKQQESGSGENLSALNQYFTSQIDASLTWKDIDWIRMVTKLPIVVKGVITEEDAILAVKHGCSGIIVSNHGSRQVDTTVSTIEALPEVMHGVKMMNALNRVEVYLDGGIRRGTDVLKALALGARAVFVGRPILWGLAVDGENGVKCVLKLLKKELELAMVLCGCPTLNDIKPSLIWNPPKRSFDINEGQEDVDSSAKSKL